jgi:hypothetical protein
MIEYLQSPIRLGLQESFLFLSVSSVVPSFRTLLAKEYDVRFAGYDAQHAYLSA